MAKNYVEEDYLKQAAGLNVVKAVYMEVDVAADEKTKEANYVVDLCKSGKYPTCAAVIGGRPGEEGFEKYIRQFKGSPYVKGVRQVLHGGGTPAGSCLSDDFVRGIRQLGELDKSFDLCMRAAELPDGAKLAEKCPDTRFILDHCGNGDPRAFFKAGDPRLKDVKPEHTADAWKRDIDLVAGKKNVICKISGIVARVPKEWSADDLAPLVNHCLGAFGPDRVVFGSDWPVCLMGAPLADWVKALRQIIASRPMEQQRALLSENAIRFYGLKV